MKKKFRVLISMLWIVALLAGLAYAGEYWGSKNSNKYHYPTCKWAQKIKPQNLIIFNSPDEAVKAGYVPCKVCRPPLPENTSTDDIDEPSDEAYAQNEQEEYVERRGCCSWHGGVCGCRNGRALCCDGTLSPSCGCE